MVEMFIKKSRLSASDINGKSMRWDERHIVDAALLKMKSSTAYRFLREKGLFPLPSEETIRKFISSEECNFGLNKLALKDIGEEIKGKPEHERWCSLIFDEAKIKPSVDWDKRTRTWRGPADYGDMIECDFPDGLATHVLVFIVRFYWTNAVQVFAIFAVKNAATPTVLSEIIVKCILALYKVGAIVKNIVCDGAKTNKSAINILGCSGKLNDTRCFFDHPADSSIKVYIFFDVPHLLNCTRNHLINHKKVMICLNEVFF